MSSIIDGRRSKTKYFSKRFSLAATAYDYDVNSNFSLFKSEHKGPSTNYSALRGSGDGRRDNVFIYPTTNPIWVKANSVDNDMIYVPADAWLEIVNIQVHNLYVTSAEGATAQIQTLDPVADSSGNLGGTYFYLYHTDATQGEIVYGVWFDVDNGNTQPTDNLVDTWVEVDISADDTAGTVGGAIATAVNALSAFSASGTTTVTVTSATANSARDAADSTDAPTGFTFDAPSTNGAGTATTVQILVV